MKLAIDPGHGNSNRKAGVYDPGAVANGQSEADIVLAWALSGRWILTREFGIEVYLTRDDDSDPTPVGSRDDKAEAAGCTNLLSLHCNAFNGKASGTETYYRDMADKGFAGTVQTLAVASLSLPNRGLKIESASQHTRLAVFDFDGPACLLELGFIDNPGDLQCLLSRENRIEFWRKFGAIYGGNKA